MSDSKKILRFSDIEAANDLETKDVDVPEWGGVLRLRVLTGKQFVDFLEQNKGKLNGGEATIKLIGISAIDPDGNPMFTTEQLEVLQRKSFRVLSRLQDVALALNGMSVDEKKKTQTETDIKNGSGEEVSAASPTTSPLN